MSPALSTSMWQSHRRLQHDHGDVALFCRRIALPIPDCCTMARYHDTPTRHAADSSGFSQKYSNYLPLHPKVDRKDSISKSDEKVNREHDATVSRASADPTTGRRRGTTRSKEHDDEEEQLQRAIEESKREVEVPGNGGRRNGKRGRDDSEE